MEYSNLKLKLVSFFDKDKLDLKSDEWGFYNEIEREIGLIGYATNLTPETINCAKQMGVDFFLTHHDSWEFVFGLKEKCNNMLLDYNISHAFFHAPLDDADFGTSASLIKALGVGTYKKVMPYADVFYAGCIGELEIGMPFEQFTAKFSNVLNEPVRAFRNNEKAVKKICVAAGGGNMTTEMKVAADSGCDTYVTGEYALYSQQYARLTGMNLFVGSHTNTEILGVGNLAEKLAVGTDLEVRKILESND